MQHNVNFNNEIVIVTGAGHGLGEKIACEFASNGAKVLFVSADNSAEQKANLCKQQGHMCEGLKADVTKQQDIQRIFDTCRSKLGGFCTVLFNCAGIAQASSLDSLTQDQLIKILTNDSVAYALTTQQALRHFQERYSLGGTDNQRRTNWIFNFSSALAKPATLSNIGGATVGYDMANAAINGLTWSTAGFTSSKDRPFRRNCPDLDVRCVGVLPYFFEGSTTDQLTAAYGFTDINSAAKMLSPSKRVGDSKQLAQTLVNVVAGKFKPEDTSATGVVTGMIQSATRRGSQWANGDLMEIDGDGRVYNVRDSPLGYWRDDAKWLSEQTVRTA